MKNGARERRRASHSNTDTWRTETCSDIQTSAQRINERTNKCEREREVAMTTAAVDIPGEECSPWSDECKVGLHQRERERGGRVPVYTRKNSFSIQGPFFYHLNKQKIQMFNSPSFTPPTTPDRNEKHYCLSVLDEAYNLLWCHSAPSRRINSHSRISKKGEKPRHVQASNKTHK